MISRYIYIYIYMYVCLYVYIFIYNEKSLHILEMYDLKNV